jgi:chromosome segregation ATPase
LLSKRQEEIVTVAEHLKEANRKLAKMRGKLQQKKQVINEYWLDVRKSESEIIELSESQLKLNTLRVGKVSEMASWITKLEQKTLNQQDRIRILQSELDSIRSSRLPQCLKRNQLSNAN